MIRIAGHRWRIVLRHLIEIAIGAVLIAAGLTPIIDFWDLDADTGIGLAVGIAVSAHVIGGVIGATLAGEWLDAPQVSWNQQGLTYRKGQENSLAWSDYRGYRFTWEYPAYLKVLRGNGRAIKVDLFAFNTDDRALLLAELDARSDALPNTRLRLTARVD